MALARGKIITDPDVRLLAGVAGSIEGDYRRDPSEDPWSGSPFEWIRRVGSSRRVGKIGEQLVAGWCAAKGLDVVRSGSSEADKIIEGRPVEIKFSTLWESGVFKFQQLRDQEYEYAICLGVAPFDARCWVIPKQTLLEYVIGHRGQHTGRAGTDTAWLSVNPDSPEKWLNACGGTLSEAFGRFKLFRVRKR